jgi:hypothetical protein
MFSPDHVLKDELDLPTMLVAIRPVKGERPFHQPSAFVTKHLSTTLISMRPAKGAGLPNQPGALKKLL